MAMWVRERPADGGGRATGDASCLSVYWIGLDGVGEMRVGIYILFGIWIFARSQEAATSPSFLGIKTDAEASAKRFSNVDSTFDSLVSTAAAVAKMGLRGEARMAIKVVARIMVECAVGVEVADCKCRRFDCCVPPGKARRCTLSKARGERKAEKGGANGASK